MRGSYVNCCRAESRRASNNSEGDSEPEELHGDGLYRQIRISETQGRGSTVSGWSSGSNRRKAAGTACQLSPASEGFKNSPTGALPSRDVSGHLSRPGLHAVYCLPRFAAGLSKHVIGVYAEPQFLPLIFTRPSPKSESPRNGSTRPVEHGAYTQVATDKIRESPRCPAVFSRGCAWHLRGVRQSTGPRSHAAAPEWRG